MSTPRRALVLDTAAAAALLSTRRVDRVRASVVEAVAAADTGVVVPTAVRVEAGWDRRAPSAARANQLVPDDDVVDRRAADRAVGLRSAVPRASVVDASVAVAAERVVGADVVEVLTSDLDDLRDLAGHLDPVGRFDVRHC